MGIDACIYVKTKDGLPPFSDGFPQGFNTCKSDGYCEDAQWKVATFSRWYAEGYERGHWPGIASVLMQLFSQPNTEKVYYFGDCSGPSEFTQDALIELCKHYMSFGNRPYFGE